MKMKRLRGFRLGRKLVKLFRWTARPRRTLEKCCLWSRPRTFSLARCLGLGRHSDPGYIRLGQDARKVVAVPKGHLAVNVGESGGDKRREVLPVMYFNHPLFGELLAQSERVYGFNHSGVITIPCGFSEFQQIKTRIANWDHCKSRRYGRSWLRF